MRYWYGRISADVPHLFLGKVTSSPPPDLRGRRPWPWGRVTIRCFFWGALTLSWYQKSSRYRKRSKMCFPEKSHKGFYHCFMEFGTEDVWTELWMIWCKISTAQYGCRNPNCGLRDVFMLWMIIVLLVDTWPSHSWMESCEIRRAFREFD